MSNLNDNEAMETGIKQLLGLEEYDAPEVWHECKHISDGFIYEQTPVFITLLCKRCGVHYDIDIYGNQI